VALYDVLHQLLHIGGVRDVGAGELDVQVALRRRAAHADHPNAVMREPLRDRRADAAARTGDERDLHAV
jgi:hypothetical protein